MRRLTRDQPGIRKAVAPAILALAWASAGGIVVPTALAAERPVGSVDAAQPAVRVLDWVIVTQRNGQDTKSPAVRPGSTYRYCGEGVSALYINLNTRGVGRGTPVTIQFSRNGSQLFEQHFRWDLQVGPVNFYVRALRGYLYRDGRFTFSLRMRHRSILTSAVSTSSGDCLPSAG